MVSAKGKTPAIDSKLVRHTLLALLLSVFAIGLLTLPGAFMGEAYSVLPL